MIWIMARRPLCRLSALCAVLGFVASDLAFAQALPAPGKYMGHIGFVTATGMYRTAAVTLLVESREADTFSGIAWDGRSPCRIDTPVTGRLQGDSLKVRGKALKDKCGIKWELRLVGDRLEGTDAGGHSLHLSR